MPTTNIITTYFRRSFVVSDPSVAADGLTVNLLRDDGAVVYLNGTEVFRSNMPVGTIGYQTLASTAVNGADESTFFPGSINPALLVAGTNVLAVEIHQSDATSSDISFDLSLIGSASGSGSSPVVTVAATDASAAEGGSDPGTFTVTRSDSTAAPLTVSYSMSGTAANGTDYQVLPGTITIPVGASSATVTVTPVDDTLVEGDETAVLTLIVGPSYTVGTASTATVVIADNDANLVAAGSVWKYLDDGSNQATAWQAPAFDDSSWKSGPAQLGYGDGDEQTVVGFGADANNKFITTYFRQSFVVSDPPVAANRLTMNLLRDDGAVVYLNGTEVFRSNMPAGTVGYQTLSSTGVSGADESAWHSASINPSLLVAGTNVLAVEIHQESATSSDISFDLSLVGSALSSTSSPLVTVAATDASAAEAGSESGKFTVSRTGSTAAPLTVSYSLGGTAGNGTDYQLLPGTITIPVGASSAAVTVAPVDDTLVEGSETVIITLTVGPSYTIGASSIATVVIADNDTNLVAPGSVWKYLDNGSNQATAWQASAFDDSTWSSGPAQLGYGDGDEQTVVGYGADANNKYITTYFRQSFVVLDPAIDAGGLAVNLLRDDGAVVYLNGTEVFRSNMPDGTIGYQTLASTTVNDAAESAWFSATINPALLVAGTNVLAVEIHQAAATSSDISFDLGLVASPSSAQGVASSLRMASFPSSVQAGVAGNFTVTVVDASNNIATGYRGTIHFSSSDHQAALPSDYTFTAADAGVHTFSATLKTAGSQSLTATDSTTSFITGTQSGIVAYAAAASNFAVAGYPSPTTAGASGSYSVTAKDPFGNTVTKSTTLSRPDHVIVVVEENRSFREIIGDTTDAPYLNTLAQTGAVFTNSFAIAHPSQPNYLALFSGSTQGITNDDTDYFLNQPNLASSLIGNGLSFGGYSEDLPSPGYTGPDNGAITEDIAPG